MRDRGSREFERPPCLRRTFTIADVEKAHAKAVAKLYNLSCTPLPSTIDVLAELRRTGAILTQEELFRACDLSDPPLPLADKPVERETRARRRY